MEANNSTPTSSSATPNNTDTNAMSRNNNSDSRTGADSASNEETRQAESLAASSASAYVTVTPTATRRLNPAEKNTPDHTIVDTSIYTLPELPSDHPAVKVKAEARNLNVNPFNSLLLISTSDKGLCLIVNGNCARPSLDKVNGIMRNFCGKQHESDARDVGNSIVVYFATEKAHPSSKLTEDDLVS